MDKTQANLGLTTTDALHKLYDEINLVLCQFKTNQKLRKPHSWIKDTLYFTSKYSRLSWVSIVFQLWVAIAFFTCFLMGAGLTLLFEALLVFLLLICNLLCELHENKLRHDEIPKRVFNVLEIIRRQIGKVQWTSENYPNLFSPFSPCITLQWTYRDGNLVNLPWALLVKDDVILVRPGQISPGYCEAMEKNSEVPLLHAKEVFSPSLQNANEMFTAPKTRQPLESKRYKLLETPFLNNLHIYLEQALDRPITQLNQQRHFLMKQIIEGFVLPITFFLVLFVNFLKYFYFELFDKMQLYETSFFIPATTILPLLPLIFPIFWNLINYIGIARFEAIFETTRSDIKFNPLEEDAENTTTYHFNYKLNYRQVLRNFLKILKGETEILCRSANILHVLGSVTALCCVDKKGVLSWPNPTAEKVFFLHNNESPSSSLGNIGDLITDLDDTPQHQFESGNSAIAEVLDLTHNHNDPFKLHFDDPDWKKFITSLKPLGLAILLNTCNIDTQEQYTAFCSHITCEAIYNENLVPVMNRRCLCELAKEIGFVDQAQKIFGLEQMLSTFRHLQPEMVRRDNKYARTLQLSTKLKFPFPHMFAVIVKELSTGAMQLLSEGTADIILDSCVDYWDGHDLCPLMHSDRKKIQDFYQRSSLTAHCTAFAYRPLNKSFNSKLSKIYLELPSDSRHLYMNYRSPTPVHWECKSVLEPKIKTSLGTFFSTDSLLYNDCLLTENVSHAESCFQMQCNQVFIGMVTMQYQPLIDMVQLIEQLERACIRFVHFSKENELRSRVFSEKMGLESGWNCHISLLTERNSGRNMDVTNERGINLRRRLSQSTFKLTHYDSNLEKGRKMSFSAPSAINMDHAVVKFNTTNENKHTSDQSGLKSSEENIQIHNESNTSHEWQSLSCLSDSTEQSAPINFDMSNRAKLPRGIDKIRPHIEFIDNVPLLVSLFTDCTSQATREMLNIMQDFHEIVCIMGSSANCENAGIFMQSDACLAVDPLYPQVCQKFNVYEKSAMIPPSELASKLNSIPCCLYFKREDPISFYRLIMEGRHFINILWNSIQFWLSCCLVLTVMQLITTLLLLPQLFTAGQILWFCCIVLPLLSGSLLILPIDDDIMKKPQNRNNIGCNWNLFIFIFWYYGGKFLPTVFIVIFCYIGILTSHCMDFCIYNNCTCKLFYLPTNHNWNENSWIILSTRLIIVFLVLLHFVMISVGFIYREYSIFKKSPTNNFVWMIIVFVLIILQSFYTIVSLNLADNSNDVKFQTPLWVVIFAAISPFFVLIINELIKYQEIKVNERFQKRARLDFGTKLGMNSPF